ncbi:hypothetical protein GN958_ATG19917 [Phytophthora infestans]|uniref:Uncharacterized protein n=1 Tax=Phytophthora infestans TaxID=4787 RepID=A0A8S9TTP7_PHYIN|nr:hypothetical protein GN958_ATG19917 [Phytophthora infestans]
MCNKSCNACLTACRIAGDVLRLWPRLLAFVSLETLNHSQSPRPSVQPSCAVPRTRTSHCTTSRAPVAHEDASSAPHRLNPSALNYSSASVALDSAATALQCHTSRLLVRLLVPVLADVSHYVPHSVVRLCRVAGVSRAPAISKLVVLDTANSELSSPPLSAAGLRFGRTPHSSHDPGAANLRLAARQSAAAHLPHFVLHFGTLAVLIDLRAVRKRSTDGNPLLIATLRTPSRFADFASPFFNLVPSHKGSTGLLDPHCVTTTGPSLTPGHCSVTNVF